MVVYVKRRMFHRVSRRITAKFIYEEPFLSVEDYTVHEITLGPGCNVPGLPEPR